MLIYACNPTTYLNRSFFISFVPSKGRFLPINVDFCLVCWVAKTVPFCFLNMGISKEALAKFKEIYRKEYGEDISDEEALKQATSLLRLMKIIYRPIPKDIDV